MDAVFKALADPSRRNLLDRLNARGGQTLKELCADAGMTRQSVSRHLAVLEAAGLVTTVRRAREKLHYLDAAPIHAVADRWMTRYDASRAQALADLKTALENPLMTTTEQATFAYTTYITTTPERLWQALIDPAFTRRYWGVAFECEWREGAVMTWDDNGNRIADPEQRVLIADPPHRLAYTWHTFTDAWAQGNGIDATTLEQLRAEPRRSHVSFEIEPVPDEDGLVKLTVVHDGLAPDGALQGMFSEAWPRLVADLKTLLEAG